jgi:hypothetical protein
VKLDTFLKAVELSVPPRTWRQTMQVRKLICKYIILVHIALCIYSICKYAVHMALEYISSSLADCLLAVRSALVTFTT